MRQVRAILLCSALVLCVLRIARILFARHAWLLLLCFGFVATTLAGVSSATVNGSASWGVDECLHTYTIDGSGLATNTTVYVNLTFDGVLQNTPNQLWIKNVSGVVSNNLPQPTGPYSGWNYGSVTVNKTVHVLWANQTTGAQLGACVDTTNWIYTTASHSQGTDAHHTENILITATGDSCPGRNNLTFTLKATLNPPIPAGFVNGIYSFALTVDGAVVYTAPNVNLQTNEFAGAVPITVTATGITTAHGSFSYSWACNGVTCASGSYQCADEVINNQVNSTASVLTASTAGSGTASNTDGSSTTTSVTQNGGDGTMPGGGSSTQTTTVNHSTTTMSSITNQDIYADVYHALMDAGNTGNFATPSSGLVTGSQPAILSTTPGTDLQTSVTAAQAAADGLETSAKAVVSTLSTNKPTSASIGTQSSWSVTLPVLGSLSVDMSPYATPISYWRLLCLAFVTVCAWFVAVRIVRSAIG